MSSKRESVSEIKLCSTNAVDELKLWVSQQNLLPELSDHVLQKFLHSCYYNVNDTKDTLTSYYSIRIKTSQIFLDRTAIFTNKTTDLGYFIKMPELTEQGYQVIVAGLFSADATDYNATDYLKLYITAVETWSFRSEENSEGLVIIADAANFTFSHLKKMEFNVVKAGFQYFQDALPVRLKKIIIINVSNAVYVLLGMMQSVIAKRLANLIEKHNSGSTKYFETVPQKMLPMEYGGDCKPVKDMNDETIQLLKENKEWLEEEDKILSDLIAKQPPRQKRYFSMFF